MGTPLKRIAIVMSGGSGERFWPLSRSSRPKPFLRLADGGKALLEQAVEILAPLFGPADIFIATGSHLARATRRLLPRIPAENLILEPARRNTAGCLALASSHVLARGGPDATVAVLAADHRIADPARYRDTLRTALAAAEHEDALVTLGVVPSRPETGYGYIETGPEISVPGAPRGIAVNRAARFHEKPDGNTARKYLSDGRFLWNSGMFFWRMSVFADALGAASPGHAAAVRTMADAIAAGDRDRLEKTFLALPDVSIDYALMEKVSNVLVVRADFGWDDLGAWDSLDRTLPRDENGNAAVGGPVLVDVRDSLVYNGPGAKKRAVAVIGVEGLAVVVTEDAVLVAPKNRAQDVRKVVAELKKRGAGQV